MIVELGKVLQAMPAIAIMLKEMIHGIVYPDSDAAKVHEDKLIALNAAIWGDTGPLTITRHNILFFLAVALDKAVD